MATHNNVNNSSNDSASRRTVDDLDNDRLSHDLAAFLSNPSLKAALADGSLDLTSYSIEDELRELEKQCIEVYRAKAADIHALRQDLNDCQSVLRQLEEMLLGFQADLGGLSVEIRQLQEKSQTLDVQLKNRKEAEQGLREFLEHIVLAPSVIHCIAAGRVNPTFLQACQELQTLYANTHRSQAQSWACDSVPAETAAGKEMQQHVHKLRLLAAAKVRDYFLQQMALLRQPQTNIRMIQVHGLLKYNQLYDFLEHASPPFAQEIFNVYTESMSKTLQQLFRTYQSQLLQLDSTKISATRHDVIAMDDSLLKDALRTRGKRRTDVFCLGNRASECLDEEARAPILAHVAGAENLKFPYERLFRSLLGHLVDAVTNEHVFCRQFFKRDAFAPLFHGTLSLLLEQIENYLFSCYDALCLLLMIKVTHVLKRQTNEYKIHSLDPFFNQITKLTWPRLKVVVEGHLRSLKQATAQKLGGVDLHAHYMSRRFAEFLCSILLILQNKPSQPSLQSPPSRRISVSDSIHSQSNAATNNMTAGEKLLEDLGELQDEFIALLERLSEEHSSQLKKVVFMINNYDQVVSLFQERRVLGKELNRFVEILMQQREYFVEAELLQMGFSKMIAFVQQTEAEMAVAGKGSTPVVNVEEVEALVLDFALNWKSNIEQVNRNVLSYFSNFRNGMEVLKQVLTQLLLYYTRFQDIIRKVWRNKLPPFCKDLVSTTIILAEIKKYAMAI